MGRRNAWVPTGRLLSHQAAIWLPLAQGGRGLRRPALWLPGGREAGADCVYMWDDSGPMITACAYSGSVNRRGRWRK